MERILALQTREEAGMDLLGMEEQDMVSVYSLDCCPNPQSTCSESGCITCHDFVTV